MTTPATSPSTRQTCLTGQRGHGGLVALLAVVALLLAACGYDETTVPRPEAATAAPGGGDDGPTCENDGTQIRSYAPEGNVLDGATVKAIKKRGRLVAGVAADTFLLAARDPSDGQIKGFDIDMAEAIAEKIFGTAQGTVELKVITAAERIPLLQSGAVDIVARNMTVNCDRWEQIAFSAIYYDAGQKVLVGADSGIEHLCPGRHHQHQQHPEDRARRDPGHRRRQLRLHGALPERSGRRRQHR